MAHYAVAGTTIAFGTALTTAASIDFKTDGQAVEVTDTADTSTKWIVTQTDDECTVECEGETFNNAVDVGDIATLTITWNDTSSNTITNALCTAKNPGGGRGEALKCSYTFKESADAGA